MDPTESQRARMVRTAIEARGIDDPLVMVDTPCRYWRKTRA